MASGAGDHGADALVTTDPLLLHGFPRAWVDAANPMSVGEAVALLGLFLRVREDFAVDLGDRRRYGFDRALFYLVVLRDLTPSGWRWFSACGAHAEHTKEDELLLVAQSAMERMERALRARDRLHEQLQLPSSRDAATEAIFYFDVALYMLGGAFDGLAQIAHAVHGLGGNRRVVGWGSKSWLRDLRRVNPKLAQMMSRGQPHRDAREMVAVLRNTIHYEALRTITWQSGGNRSERVIVPTGIEADLEATVARAGASTAFGLSRDTDGRLYIEPGTYIEAILPRVFAAANAIMDGTPVETLPGVTQASLPTGPPEDRIFGADMRARLRLLGGVG